MLNNLLLQLLTGLSGASTLFLVAAGLTVIFGVTRVVNFAHGSLCMLGAYLGWTIFRHVPHDPLGFAATVLLTALATAAIGVVLEVALLRRIYRSAELFQLLATFGVVLMVQDITQAIWGAEDLALPRPPWLRASVALLGGRYPIYDLVMIGVGPLVLGLLWLLFTRTRWGTLVRAATFDREMLGALGVDQRLLFTTVFALGAGLAGLGGVLSLPDATANLNIDLGVITDAFVVVVVGGLGSLGGAYLASLLIAVAQAFGVLLLPGSTLVLAFLVMAAVLALRPRGLLGRVQAPSRQAGVAQLIRPAAVWEVALGAVVLLVAVSAPLWAGPFVLSVLTEALIAMLFAASLHVMMGPGGMASFGHAAWFGIGAYAVGLLAPLLPAPAALLAAMGVAAGVAALLGVIVVRLSGVYLAMLTLAFAQIVWALAFQWASLTGGDNGLLGIRRPGWAAEPAVFYLVVLGLCVGVTLLLRRILFAPLGSAIRATRDSPLRAEAIGLDTTRLRLAAFTLAACGAGLAGGLFSYAKGSVFPGYVSISHSVDALLMVLLGGVEAMSGPIIGALAYTGLYDMLLRVTSLWRLCLGAVIIVLVVAFPQGIAGRRAT